MAFVVPLKDFFGQAAKRSMKYSRHCVLNYLLECNFIRRGSYGLPTFNLDVTFWIVRSLWTMWNGHVHHVLSKSFQNTKKTKNEKHYWLALWFLLWSVKDKYISKYTHKNNIWIIKSWMWNFLIVSLLAVSFWY